MSEFEIGSVLFRGTLRGAKGAYSGKFSADAVNVLNGIHIDGAAVDAAYTAVLGGSNVTAGQRLLTLQMNITVDLPRFYLLLMDYASNGVGSGDQRNGIELKLNGKQIGLSGGAIPYVASQDSDDLAMQGVSNPNCAPYVSLVGHGDGVTGLNTLTIDSRVNAFYPRSMLVARFVRTTGG